jgi:hypothetical protein
MKDLLWGCRVKISSYLLVNWVKSEQVWTWLSTMDVNWVLAVQPFCMVSLSAFMLIC